MFEGHIDYPCAIADQSEEGHEDAASWILDRLSPGQIATLWVSQKNVLDSNEEIRALNAHPRFRTITQREGGVHRAGGPVLAMYPGAADLGYVTEATGITALCVVQWPDMLPVWISETGSTELYSQTVDDEDLFPAVKEIDPVVVENLEAATRALNHNNTINSGCEKKLVAPRILELYDKGHPLDADALMQ